MKRDEFGDRMKAYEAIEAGRRLDTSLPVYARIDGRGFSRFTRGLARPFDPRMTAAMQETTRHLVDQTEARIGYTQSDEISLVWVVDPTVPGSQMFFDGKVQKLCSVLASLATAAFTRAVLTSGDESFVRYADRLPHFDARVSNLPSREEAANAFVWREMDATRNAVSMTASAYFSHKSLQGAGVADMLLRLEGVDVNFDGMPEAFRRGSYFRRVTFDRPFLPAELERIPTQHRPPAGTLVTRSEVRQAELPPLLRITNRAEVLLDGEEPRVRDGDPKDEEREAV